MRPPRRRGGAAARRSLAVAGLLLVLTACGSPVPSGVPVTPPTSQPASTGTALPTPSPSPPTSPSAQPSPSPSQAPSPYALDPRLFLRPLPVVEASLATAVTSDQRAMGLPGVQVYVRWPDGTGWAGAAGYADLARKRPVSAADVFDVGSITKTFVAALTLRLVEQGRLSLDDHLSRWLPTYPGAARITVRELLSHTSGLADYFNDQALLNRLGAAPRRLWTPQQLLPYVARPRFAPGTGFYYSNTNYLLLGMILRQVTGGSIGEALSSAFFRPLGLSRTVFQTDQPVVAPVAAPYDYRSGSSGPLVPISDGSGWLPFTSLASSLNTAGAVVSDARDLATWAAALYGGQVLAPGSLTQMLDFGLTQAYHGRFIYGLGVQRTIVGGQLTVGHSGICSGYRATMRYLPATGLTVVVLTNINGPDPDRIAADLITRLVGSRCDGTCRLAHRL